MSIGEIELISHNQNDEKDKVNTLIEAYSSLYNSLGVEPGLLSKTKVGRELNEKFRDDSIDSNVTAYNYLQDKLNERIEEKSNEDPVIENSSPLRIYVMPTENIGFTTIKSNVDICKQQLAEVLRTFQLEENLSTEEIIEELKKYLKEYANEYFIVLK